MMLSNTYCENVVGEIKMACDEDGGDVACSSPEKKNVAKVYCPINKESPKTYHGAESLKTEKTEACLSNPLQHQSQVYSLDFLKIEKSEPFLFEENHNSGSSKSKSDCRSPSNDLFRISLYNVIKVEPQIEMQGVVDQTLTKTADIQNKYCSTGSPAPPCKTVRNKRKHCGKQKNRIAKRTKQRASTSENEQQRNHVTDKSSGTVVLCANNAADEQQVDHVPNETKRIEVPCAENAANKQQENHITNESNGIKASCAENAVREVAAAMTIDTLTSRGDDNQPVITDMPASESSHMVCKSVATDKPKSVSVDSQTYEKFQIGITVADIHVGRQHCVASSSETPMPSTNNRETNANSFDNGPFKSEKEDKYASSGHWSSDQGKERQGGSKQGYSPWQRRDRKNYPHEVNRKNYPREVNRNNYPREMNRNNYPREEWCQVNPWEPWSNEVNRQSQENWWQNQGYGWKDHENQKYNRCHLEDPGNDQCNQGNWWHNQGNEWHNQVNGWHNQINGWHNQGNGWHNQRNGWHNQGNGWHNQGGERCYQGNGWHYKSNMNQNVRNGWHNFQYIVQKPLQNSQARGSHWGSQANNWHKQNRWQNQSNSFQNRIWQIQKSGFTQQKHNGNMSGNKSCQTEDSALLGKESKPADRKDKENVPSMKKEVDYMFTKCTVGVHNGDTNNRGNSQNKREDDVDCKMVNEIIRIKSAVSVGVGKTKQTSEKGDETDDGMSEVHPNHNQNLNCSGSTTDEFDEDVIYIKSEGNLKQEETAGGNIESSSVKYEDKCVKKNTSLENIEDDICFANKTEKCVEENADDEFKVVNTSPPSDTGKENADEECKVVNTTQLSDASKENADDKCKVVNTTQPSDASGGNYSSYKTESPHSSSAESSKPSNLDEIKIMWENVNTSNLSSIPLIDIT